MGNPVLAPHVLLLSIPLSIESEPFVILVYCGPKGVAVRKVTPAKKFPGNFFAEGKWV
jgi:hypothetical protein